MKLIYLVILLIMWSQIAISQEIKPDSLVYRWHISWDGNVVSADSVFNRTYNFAKGVVYLYYPPRYLEFYPFIEPDSVVHGYFYGDGFQLYVKDQYDKGIEEGNNTLYEWLFWATITSIVIYGMAR